MQNSATSDIPVGFEPVKAKVTRILWVTVGAAVVTDSLLELSVWWRPALTPHCEAALNAGFLMAVLLPVVYFAMFCPMRRLLDNYRTALEEIKTLRGIIPICSECKKIRTEKKSWEDIESYISSHSQAIFSHGLCDDCMRKLYPEDAGPIIEQIDATDG